MGTYYEWQTILKRINMAHEAGEVVRRDVANAMREEAKALRAEEIATAMLGEER